MFSYWNMTASACEDVSAPFSSAWLKMTVGPACCTDGVSFCGAHTPLTCEDASAFNGEAVYGYQCELRTDGACAAAGGKWEANDEGEMECHDESDGVRQSQVGLAITWGLAGVTAATAAAAAAGVG